MLVRQLPDVHRATLRRLIGHLRTLAGQSERNRMTVGNLAAIWGPTLLATDAEPAAALADFSRTSAEAEVCADLISGYADLFSATQEELAREERIVEKTASFSRNPNPVKLSGEMVMFVYFDTKSGDNSVGVAVTPKMTALELQTQALAKLGVAEGEGFTLHEVVLAGQLERPLHYSELIYEVTLKWWQWSEADRRETYLLLKRNAILEEALLEAAPPLSVFGEAFYHDGSKGASFKKYNFR